MTPTRATELWFLLPYSIKPPAVLDERAASIFRNLRAEIGARAACLAGRMRVFLDPKPESARVSISAPAIGPSVERRAMKALIVLTSNDKRGLTGDKTGFWLEEFAAPYYVFKDGGMEITLASPKGGQPPIEPHSQASKFQTDSTRRLNADAIAKSALASTVKLSDVNSSDLDLVFYPGGHGPLWDLVEDRASIALIEAMSAADKPIGAVCHGVAVFRHAQVGGRPVVCGRRVTGFANTEEEAGGMTPVVPFLVEDMLKENGAHYVRSADWAECVVVDGNLVTGQNPASSIGVARELRRLAEAAKL